jgi:hypothetical protein
MTTDNDPFAYRNHGGQFEIGGGEEQGISALIKTKDTFLVITKKSIYSTFLADQVDPERTNPKIPKHSQQKILAYGSDDSIVGRTLLQADALFKDHALPSEINSEKAINIALSFLKEMAVLHELTNKYSEEEKQKNSLFNGQVSKDESLHLPSIHDIEQQTKTFLINGDHAARHIMELAQLFYPDIKNDKWTEQLVEKIKKEKGAGDPSTKFAEVIGSQLWLIRNLRNAIEHPKAEDRVKICDYTLTKLGHVKSPMISYANKETPLSEKLISKFMTNTTEILLVCFEVLMAYLCNIHAEPFAGDVRSVIEIPVTSRAPHETHVHFGYHIAWTR